MNTPIVLIHSGTSLEDFYEQIIEGLNARWHNYQPTFPECPISEAEYGDIMTNSAYATHASDGYTMVDDYHVRCPNGDIVHIERLIS